MPAADDGVAGDAEVRVLLLLVLAEELDDGPGRKVITADLRGRGADALADALDQVWARRPVALTVTTGK